MRLPALLLYAVALSAQVEAPLRVLFLGNSYTYYNSLPEMVMALANETPGRKIEAKSVTRGGATLADLWSLTNGLDVLRNGAWDAVVLQDQSTLGQNYEDGRWSVNEPAGLLKWGRFWNAEIQRKNAKLILYMTWARKAHPGFQTYLDYGYSEAARDLNGSIAPAGLAWKRIREMHPQIELFDPDGSHPAPAGTYLNACVFLETLVGRTCEGAKLPAGVQLLEADQLSLNEAAHNANEQYRAGLLSNLPKPDFGLPRPLPPAAAATAQDFVGTWRGSANLYNGPHEMELIVNAEGKTCRGNLTLSNPRSGFKTAYPLTNCTVDISTLVFFAADPRAHVEEFRAVLSDGKLMGLHSMRSTDPYLKMQGSFELRKNP